MSNNAQRNKTPARIARAEARAVINGDQSPAFVHLGYWYLSPHGDEFIATHFYEVGQPRGFSDAASVAFGLWRLHPESPAVVIYYGRNLQEEVWWEDPTRRSE